MDNEETAEAKLESVANTSDLAVAIKRLERKRQLLEEELQDDLHLILQNLKPANILKNTLHEVQESAPLKNNLLKVVLGLGAGYFSRKLMVGKSAGIVKKALGAALQFGVTQFVAKKSDGEEGNGFPEKPRKKNLLKRILSI